MVQRWFLYSTDYVFDGEKPVGQSGRRRQQTRSTDNFWPYKTYGEEQSKNMCQATILSVLRGWFGNYGRTLSSPCKNNTKLTRHSQLLMTNMVVQLGFPILCSKFARGKLVGCRKPWRTIVYYHCQMMQQKIQPEVRLGLKSSKTLMLKWSL